MTVLKKDVGNIIINTLSKTEFAIFSAKKGVIGVYLLPWLHTNHIKPCQFVV